MPRDGSLVAQPTAGSTSVAPNTTILSSLHNNEMLDIYGLFNTQWPVALGGSGATSGSNFSDINNTASILRPLLLDTSGTLAAGGAASAVTVTANRAYTAYGTAAGQLGNGTMLSMRMASASVSGGTTLAVSSPSSLGTKPVLRQGGTAIGNMDWLANTIATFVYTTAAAYNSGNGAWVLISPSVAGMGGFDDGAVGTPGIYFSADPDTGFYRIGANNFGATAGGAKVVDIGTNGVSVINNTNAQTIIGLSMVGNRPTGAAADAIGVNFVLNNAAGVAKNIATQYGILLTATAGAEEGSIYWSVIKAGAAANIVRLTSAALEPITNDLVPLGNGLRGWSDLFLASGAVINFANNDVTLTHATDALAFAGAANGYSFDAAVSVTSANAFQAYAGLTAPTTAARIQLASSSAVPGISSRASSTGSVSHLTIENANGVVGKIGSNGNDLEISSPLASGGISIPNGWMRWPATQVPSSDANTLDDYKEGTFTPSFSATGSTFSYAARNGFYTKVGNLVSFTIYIQLNTTGNTLAANQVFVTNMPFAGSSGTNEIYNFQVYWVNSTSSYVQVIAQMQGGQTALVFAAIGAASTSMAAISPTAAQLLNPTTGSLIVISGSYRTTT